MKEDKEYNSIIDSLSQKFGRKPTSEEIMLSMRDKFGQGFSETNVKMYFPTLLSLDSAVDEDGRSLHEIISSKDVEPDSYVPDLDEINFDYECIRKCIAELSSMERDVIMLHYGIDGEEGSKNLGQIGSMLNLSRERIRQIKKKAERKLKKSYELKKKLNPE